MNFRPQAAWSQVLNQSFSFVKIFVHRYDTNRVIACQGRMPERFYYVLSGRGKDNLISNWPADKG